MKPKELLTYGIIASGISAALLFFATGDMEYGFYTFLRFAVMFASAFTAFVAYKFKSYIISTLSVLIALVFNPFIPVTLQRDTWNGIDIIAAMYLLLLQLYFI